MSNPPDDEFFDEPSEHSQVKARIVSKYVHGWARILTDHLRRTQSNVQVAFVDLFSGPGTYADGTPSTPILILKYAVQDPKLTPTLRAYFNDWNKENADSLEEEISQLPGIENLAFTPKVTSKGATVEHVESLNIPNGLPVLFFLDPFGYKALSMPLLSRALAEWAECIFFFNYRRVNAALNNSAMAKNMVSLFGEDGIVALRAEIKTTKSVLIRESIVMKHLEAALKRAGAQHVVAFAFKVEDKHRSTHHLIFATKHRKGLDLMKITMAAESFDTHGVPTMVCTQRPQNLLLFAEDQIGHLALNLQAAFAGRTLTLAEIFNQHSVNTNFVPANYRTAILALEETGKVGADPPASQRPAPKGKLTMAETTKITFPEESK